MMTLFFSLFCMSFISPVPSSYLMSFLSIVSTVCVNLPIYPTATSCCFFKVIKAKLKGNALICCIWNPTSSVIVSCLFGHKCTHAPKSIVKLLCDITTFMLKYLTKWISCPPLTPSPYVLKMNKSFSIPTSVFVCHLWKRKLQGKLFFCHYDLLVSTHSRSDSMW